MTVAAAHELIGRDAELDQVHAIATLASDGRGGLIRGEAGIGKTSLWERGVDAAAEAGIRVLSVRCVEAELPLAFAVLADLVEDVVSEVADALTPPHRRALDVALGGHVAAAGDALVLPRAVLAALRLLVEDGPALVALDDAQWIDLASARVLAFVLRRLGDRPVAALATLRGGPDTADPLRLADAYGVGLVHLDLAPLSAGALQRLLRVRLGVRLPRPTLWRVQQAADGNPMFALEFARAAAGPGWADPLTIPQSLEDLVRGRIERLPSRLRPLLELVAVLERPTAGMLGRALGGEDSALELIEAAVNAEAVTVDEQEVVRFTHPLLGSGVYGRLTPEARRRLHRRAAELYDDLEPRARHAALGCGRPDARVAALLDQAGTAAARRGAPDAAAELLEQARRLTPDRELAARHERGLRLARYLTESSQTIRAAATLDELLEGDVRGSLRAEALVLRAVLDDDAARAVARLEEAQRHCGDDQRLAVRVLLARASGTADWLGDLAAAEVMTRAALERSHDLGDVVLRASILKETGRIAALRGRPEPELMRAALEFEEEQPASVGQGSARFTLAEQLVWAGELAKARALVEAELVDLERRGNEFDRSWRLRLLAGIELLQGDLESASRHAAEAEELVEPDDAHGQFVVRELQALLAVHAGAVSEGRRLAREGLAHAEQAKLRLEAVRHRWLLGYLELSRGDPVAAWQWLEGRPEELERMGVGEPSVVPLLPDAIEALVELGETAQAELLLRRLEAQAMALEHRWAIPAAARSRALLLLAKGEAGAAIAEATSAAAAFELRGFPLDQARALFVAGQALRRSGERRQAAATLAAAGEIFGSLGAKLWRERTEQELARANPRPRRDRELTPAERRVAALVAAGRTNREVSAQLYVTVATVEAHLTRIYRKLGVRSRAELARHVAAGSAASEDET